jgi:hypothetical protein
VSTRKLILLALVCGLAILLAGGIQLFTLRDQRVELTVLAVGAEAVVGDSAAAVLASERRDDVLELTVRVRAGEQPVTDAWAGWAVIGAAGRLGLVPGSAEACAPATIAPGEARSCVLGFVLPDDRSEGLTAVFRSSDDTARWALDG